MKKQKNKKPSKKDPFEKRDNRTELILIIVIVLIALGGLAMGYTMVTSM